MQLALWQEFLTTVKGSMEAMLAWIGHVKNLIFMLEDIGIVIADKDHILTLTMYGSQHYI
jgi:hypothetical protein